MISKSLLSAMVLASALVSSCNAQTNSGVSTLNSDQIEVAFDQAEALRRGGVDQTDLQLSLEIFERLAAQGNARSMDRVGLAKWRGKGTEQDIELAEDMFRKAVEGGHTKSLINLGRLLGETGRGSEAFAVLQDAVAKELKGAELVIARGHVNGTFGDLSDPQAGQRTLEALAAAGDTKASLALADALRGGASLAPDPERSLVIFERLAAAGNANAHYRVGTAYMRGIGTEPDLERAIAAYKASAAAGRKGALVNLGRAQSEAGLGSEARATFETAVSLGIEKAKFWLARGHYDRRFGEASEYARGAEMLYDLANSGSQDAAAVVVKGLRKRVLSRRDYTRLVSLLKEGVANNDGKSVETLVAFYRLYRRAPQNARELRRDLLDMKGQLMTPSVFLAEKIELAADVGPRVERWKNVDTILSSVDGQLYARGLITAYKADRRAYTYHLQLNLSKRGYYDGEISGWMTARTVRSFRSYCVSEGIDDLCMHGPMRVDAVRAMAELWG
ncbi:MAG: tetratricopeptide repeat protein [Pseudomonadota bacterium]